MFIPHLHCIALLMGNENIQKEMRLRRASYLLSVELVILSRKTRLFELTWRFAHETELSQV